MVIGRPKTVGVPNLSWLTWEIDWLLVHRIFMVVTVLSEPKPLLATSLSNFLVRLGCDQDGLAVLAFRAVRAGVLVCVQAFQLVYWTFLGVIKGKFFISGASFLILVDFAGVGLGHRVFELTHVGVAGVLAVGALPALGLGGRLAFRLGSVVPQAWDLVGRHVGLSQHLCFLFRLKLIVF